MLFFKQTIRYGTYFFVFSIIIFWVISELPGNAADILLEMQASPENRAVLLRQLGLDIPFFERYISWFYNFLLGDWGLSYVTQSSVSALIGSKVLISLFLATYAMILTVLIAIPVAIKASLNAQNFWGHLIQVSTSLALSIPSFWLGLLLITFFAFMWPVFPSSANISYQDGFFQILFKMVLPAFALAIPQSAALSKILYASLMITKRQNYVLVAKSKGLTDQQIFYRHQLKNALIPTIENLGLQFSFLFVGAIIIENLFLIPGIGRQLLSSVRERDVPVIMAILTVLFAITLILQFLCATINNFIDRRTVNR